MRRTPRNGPSPPRFRFVFEDAVISCGEDGGEIVAIDRRGQLKSYGSPDDTPQFFKLSAAIDRVHGAGHDRLRSRGGPVANPVPQRHA